jgi:hypothetical protein
MFILLNRGSKGSSESRNDVRAGLLGKEAVVPLTLVPSFPLASFKPRPRTVWHYLLFSFVGVFPKGSFGEDAVRLRNGIVVFL